MWSDIDVGLINYCALSCDLGEISVYNKILIKNLE